MELSLMNEVDETTAEQAQTKNAQVLEAELAWLYEVIHTRIALHFGHEAPYHTIREVPVPDLSEAKGVYADWVKRHQLDENERLALILALTPHLMPCLLDVLCAKNKEYDRPYSEFGGTFMDGHAGFIPTADTLMFILAGGDILARIRCQGVLQADHLFCKAKVISHDINQKKAPRLSGTWMVSHEYVDYLISGQPYVAKYGEDFPAHQITTGMEWEDIILAKNTSDTLQEIRDWSQHGNQILEELGLGKRLKPGYKSLFYGPPGTGKTMTAALLGKGTNKPVYKIDLSMVVSKYIGETEKNLSKVFDQAESQDWILFFDEADSLFGKRTQVHSANDRFGNQEVGYLLQRIEDFPGVVILASNLKENIDEAFTRRFQSMVEFRMPGVEERFKLWERSFSKKLPLDPGVDKWAMAEKYELSGGVMMNVVRKCTLRAVTQQWSTISQKELEDAIRQELHKEGILLS